MDTSELSRAINQLSREAPRDWLKDSCAEIRSWPSGIQANTLIARLPVTYNGDIAFQLSAIIRQADGLMSWEALAWSIEMCASAYSICQKEQDIELLWSGPSPTHQIPARRIDQALYDILAAARRDILLVTFAAYNIHRLTDVLAVALTKNIRVRLLLEFEEESQNQLSTDALKAFPTELRTQAEIYYWPLEKRERNGFGRPGKLHAKAAVIDDQALLSSANLTDDAFTRNLEVGALFVGGEIPKRLRNHFESLISSGMLVRWIYE